MRAAGKPWSFLHVSKPEIDLDPALDPYDAAVYAKGAENLQRMVDAGVLIRDARPTLLRLSPHLARPRADRPGRGRLASPTTTTNRIRKHELTTPVKEDDRVRQIEAINAETGPVMIAYPDARRTRRAARRRRPKARRRVDVTADDGVRHQMWTIDGRRDRSRADRGVRRAPGALHRRRPPPRRGGSRVFHARGTPASAVLPVGRLPAPRDDHPRLQPRAEGPERHDARTALLAALGERFTVAPADGPVSPRAANEFGLYVDGRWYRADAEAGPDSRRRSGRPAADLASDAQRHRAAVRYRRPTHATSASTSWVAAAGWRSSRGGSIPARWRLRSRSTRRR